MRNQRFEYKKYYFLPIILPSEDLKIVCKAAFTFE